MINGIEDLKNKLSTFRSHRADYNGAEDLVGEYELAKMIWRKWINLIMHFQMMTLMEKNLQKGYTFWKGFFNLKSSKYKIKIIGFKISEAPKQSFEK